MKSSIPIRRPMRYRPYIEALECRRLPSTVTNLLDSGPGSLRQAILDTPAGGTVDFQSDLSGTIALTSGELRIAKDLAISGPGAGMITVSGSTVFRVFEIAGPFNVSLSGLTVADGRAVGGIGGGILNFGTLTVTGSVLSGNGATGMTGQGGGIFNWGTLTISSSTVSGNSSAQGGGGIFNFGTVTLTDSTVSGNTTPANGGGINNNTNATLVVTGSTFSGNSATSASSGFGGAIINFATLAVTNSTLADNHATAFGGGIANVGPAQLAVNDCTISSNVGGFGGGGLDAGGAGPTVSNTILAGNAAPGSPNVRGTLASQGYNLIGDGTGGSGYADTDLVGTAAHPIDPLLGPLQGNGGPTPTMALLPGSPALNAGDPEELGSPDQRGVVRTGAVNIGAYQASATGLLVRAPRRVHSGVPFDVTVTAIDPYGQVAVGYTGTVTFSTSDPDLGVVLPADYTFTLGDAGQHTFTDTGLGETTLLTLRRQTVTVTDTADGSITGSVSVRVRRTVPAPGPGDRALSAAPVSADADWFPARSIRREFAEEPWWGDWIGGP